MTLLQLAKVSQMVTITDVVVEKIVRRLIKSQDYRNLLQEFEVPHIDFVGSLDDRLDEIFLELF